MKKVKEESAIGIFPFLFFILGLLFGMFNIILKDSLWGWVVWTIGMLFYFLFVKWFYYELKLYKKKKAKSEVRRE